jgi:hypothetical protein
VAQVATPLVLVQDSEESFVIHFGTDLPRVNAYTLASTLVAIANAAKAANAATNPGLEIEIVVEALGAGSFRTRVRALYKSAGNLFSAQTVVGTLVLNIIAAYIFQVTLAPDQDVKVTVNTDEVVIEAGKKTVVIPRKVHDAMKEAEKSPEFRNGVADVFEAVERDSTVNALGIGPSMDGEPAIMVPRDAFRRAVDAVADSRREEDVHDVVEQADVQIMRAIFERKRRRWEFAWRGIRISAPILDDGFNAQFLARKVPLHPGDGLQVMLRMRRHKDPLSGVVVNDPNGYEVTKVLKHIPGQSQTEITP